MIMKTPFRDIARGIVVVARTAASGVWVRPMKRSATATVDGNPAMTPPTLLPYRSATTVLRVTHALPTMKLRPSLYQNIESI
jgi:hypothetical protein